MFHTGYLLSWYRAEGESTNRVILINDTISKEENNVYDLEVLQLCAENNETKIYYLTLFAQNNIGEGNESNSIAYTYQCKFQTIFSVDCLTLRHKYLHALE